MISLLITLLVAVVIAALVFWIVSLLPLPSPWNRVVQVIVLVIFLICLLEYVVPGFRALR